MLKVNELFAGIGSQYSGLERNELDFKVVNTAEIDKDAMLSYAAIHCGLTLEMVNTCSFPEGKEMAQYLAARNIGFVFKKNEPYDWFKIIGRKSKALEKYYLACILSKNIGDISKIEKLGYADFWTYSFPCQDISVAGKQKGINKNTRSGLLYEVERLLEKSKECGELPKYLMLENVKNLVGKKFKPQFEEWIQRLDELGFNTYWQVLNAKNYGIPQNRERVFGISIRKDIDTGYVFPEPFELKIRLKDILEKEVDEKYYLSEKMIQYLVSTTNWQGSNRAVINKDIANCINTGEGSRRCDSSNYISKDFPENCDIKPILIGGMQKHQAVKTDGISTCLSASMGMGGGYVPMVTEPSIAASRGRNPENPSDRTAGSPTEQRLEINQNGTSNTITTVQKDNYVVEPNNIKHTELPCIYDDRDKGFGIKTSNICPTQRAERYGIKCIETDYRIRKLTPLECWRLMGFADEQFYKAEKVNSNSQLYKQAGNSIVVDVLYYLFKNLFIDKPTGKQIIETDQLPGQMNITDFIGGAQ